MKKFLTVILCMALCLSFAAAAGNSEKPQSAEDSYVPQTITEKYWYVIGEDLFAYYIDYYSYYQEDFDVEAFIQGVKDYANGEFTLTSDEIDAIASEYNAYKANAEAEASAENLARAEAFLKENSEKEGIVTTESGLQYQVMTLGSGDCPEEGDVVIVDYTLSLSDGSIIDQGSDVMLIADNAHVISGFAEGLQLMPVGSTYKLFIHPTLGYGANANGTLPGNSLLLFEVTLKSIIK